MVAARLLWWVDNSWCLSFTPWKTRGEDEEKEKTVEWERLDGTKGRLEGDGVHKSARKGKMRKKRSDEIRKLNLLDGKGGITQRSQGAVRQTEGRKQRKPPMESDEDSCRACLLWPLTGTQMLFKDALSHPRTQSSLLLYFILRSAGAAESVRRFHRPNQPLISKTSPLKRIGPGNLCQGLVPV